MANSSHSGRNLAALVIALAIGFGWGLLTHANRWFPYGPLVALKRSVFPTPPAPRTYSGAHQELSSRSPAFAPLRALAYVGSGNVPADGNHGVLLNAPGAFPGYTLLYPRWSDRAVLVDLEGTVVWEWSYPQVDGWQHVEVLPDGGVVVVSSSDKRVLRLDRNSRLQWIQNYLVHHDFTIDGDEIVALTRSVRDVPELHPTAAIHADSITWIDLETGAINRSLDLLDAVRRSEYAYLLPAVQHLEFPPEDVIDPLHTNHVEVLDGRFADRARFYAAGGLLVTMRALNAALIVDPATGAIEWLWGPTTLTYPHHPSMTPAGTILVFNNGMENSEVLEVDPVTREVVWHYTDPEFFSETRGSAQRLPNGNTLITESNSAYVFEVTAEGEKVWEYIGPWTKPEDGNRQPIWRATRFSPDALPPTLRAEIEDRHD